MEHMAKAIDFMGEIQRRNPKEISEEYERQANDPELLHYDALSQYVNQKLRVISGPNARRYAYFTAGQLVAILADIPFMDNVTWGKLVDYARGCEDKRSISSMKHRASVLHISASWSMPQ